MTEKEGGMDIEVELSKIIINEASDQQVIVLKERNGWAEWCITEDAELGLRIFEHGFDASYVPESYGRGLAPDTFIDY